MCFYNCCKLKLQFGPIFEISTFDFGAKFQKKSRFFKPLITPEPQIRKFQNWAEMKVNYPTNNKNTPMDFSDNFHNIKNFFQVDRIEKIMKNHLNFSFCRSQKKRRRSENFSYHQNWMHISAKLLCKNYRNIGLPCDSEFKLKPTVKISGTDNNIF